MQNDLQRVHFIIFGKKTYLNDNVVWTSVLDQFLILKATLGFGFFILFSFHKTFEFEGNFAKQSNQIKTKIWTQPKTKTKTKNQPWTRTRPKIEIGPKTCFYEGFGSEILFYFLSKNYFLTRVRHVVSLRKQFKGFE
jgi:hypothetical protein